jgi:hypothetical protein
MSGTQNSVTTRSNAVVIGSVLAWIPAVLLLDSRSTLLEQTLLGVLTWILLIALLRTQPSLVRAQTAVVVIFATLVEFTFSPLLHVYVYRFHNVPAFVPPGHGLVYLAALAIGGTVWVQRHAKTLITITVTAGGIYALWGLSPLAPRLDVLGAFWYVCLVGFFIWGRSRLVYVGAFLVVTYLEVLGTTIGTWTWSVHDPTGLIPIGNPPTGAAGGYGWFDLVAIAMAPVVVRFAQRCARRWSGRSETVAASESTSQSDFAASSPIT